MDISMSKETSAAEAALMMGDVTAVAGNVSLIVPIAKSASVRSAFDPRTSVPPDELISTVPFNAAFNVTVPLMTTSYEFETAALITESVMRIVPELVIGELIVEAVMFVVPAFVIAVVKFDNVALSTVNVCPEATVTPA